MRPEVPAGLPDFKTSQHYREIYSRVCPTTCVQLPQVILNLLRNGSDAMNSVDDRPRELLFRTEMVEDERVRLSVQDSGTGFEAQSLDRLFQTFYTTKEEGMGIGLAVSRSIIENHHGRLWATPNDGPGVTFSFSIPCVVERSENSSLEH